MRGDVGAGLFGAFDLSEFLASEPLLDVTDAALQRLELLGDRVEVVLERHSACDLKRSGRSRDDTHVLRLRLESQVLDDPVLAARASQHTSGLRLAERAGRIRNETHDLPALHRIEELRDGFQDFADGDRRYSRSTALGGRKDRISHVNHLASQNLAVLAVEDDDCAVMHAASIAVRQSAPPVA